MGNDGDTLSLTKDGVKIKSSKDIIVEGKNINFNANGSVNIKAKSDVKLKVQILAQRDLWEWKLKEGMEPN